ncbi:hypothetical protein GPJ56_003543 [Histomonas meleagridis]|uniref:uncharacterized protein n=1 Tax=Histomonas meleagridis TaxID=135588 RepID=UPI003559D1B9|nr:hypothetical protein GPJ56_003543 [Histomonas meleagridis]KAH0806429.1 hypothetical protein GO595_000804 [Histomonas meleagridis]
MGRSGFEGLGCGFVFDILEEFGIDESGKDSYNEETKVFVTFGFSCFGVGLGFAIFCSVLSEVADLGFSAGVGFGLGADVGVGFCSGGGGGVDFSYVFSS